MRFRYKPWVDPELEASPYVCMEPEEYKNNWNRFFTNPELPLSLELGCGKGRFISTIALSEPKKNFLGIDIESIALGFANRLLEQSQEDYANVRLVRMDISKIANYFSENQITEIYMNFPNPWPKKRQNKRRLTHPKQLVQYRPLLQDGGYLYFRTDDQEMYEASLSYLQLMDFELVSTTEDLPIQEIMTEYEERWRSQGIKIKAITARKTKADSTREHELKEIAKNYQDKRDTKFVTQ